MQINGNDLIGGSTLGIGPYRERAARPCARAGEGDYLQGYDRFDKTQFQVNTVKTFSNVLGADNMLLVGEVGAQSNDVPDYTKGGLRYGRGFMYGTGSGPEYGPAATPQGQPRFGALSGGNLCSPTLVGAPVPIANALLQPAAGRLPERRLRDRHGLGLPPAAVGSTTTTVRARGVAHHAERVLDARRGRRVDGPDQFIEDRQTLGLGLELRSAPRSTCSTSTTSVTPTTAYDPLFDRDYYSASRSA